MSDKTFSQLPISTTIDTALLVGLDVSQAGAFSNSLVRVSDIIGESKSYTDLTVSSAKSITEEFNAITVDGTKDISLITDQLLLDSTVPTPADTTKVYRKIIINKTGISINVRFNSGLTGITESNVSLINGGVITLLFVGTQWFVQTLQNV